MAEAVATQARNGTVATTKESIVSYTPLGETEEIHLTVSRIKLIVCQPTRSGALPNEGQILKFMLMCKAGGLNPYVGDAYLTGYDTKDGPEFSLITAIQSLLKRAEASPEFDGIEQGVIVERNGQITERQGDLVLAGETLIGGWARVHRRDRKIPSYDSVNLDTFDKKRSRWNTDPAGMIVKCAQASALRTAFPSTLAAMYCKEEMDRERESHGQASVVVDSRPKTDRLADRLLPVKSSPVIGTTAVQEATQPQLSLEPEQLSTDAGMFLNAVTDATNPADLEDIFNAVREHMETIGMEQAAYDEIKAAIDAKRATLK
jgi:phage recombination protein Bet